MEREGIILEPTFEHNAANAECSCADIGQTDIETWKKLYEEKYGEYVREEITNPTGYILAGRQTLSEITAKILEIVKDVKALEEDNKDILVMEKDLERIVRKAGLEVPENLNDLSAEDVVLSVEKYETAFKNQDLSVKSAATD